MFTKNNKINLKCKIDEKINLYSRCIGCCFKKSVTINKKEISDLLKKV